MVNRMQVLTGPCLGLFLWAVVAGSLDWPLILAVVGFLKTPMQHGLLLYLVLGSKTRRCSPGAFLLPRPYGYVST